MDSSLEVSVTGEDGSSDEIALLDGFVQFWGDVSGVSDTGHASVSGGHESEFVEVLGDSRSVEVLSDDSGSWGEGGLDVWLDLETSLDGVSGEETSSHQRIWVGGVGATGDGSENDVSVGESVVLTLEGEVGCGLGLFWLKSVSLESNLVGENLAPLLLLLGDGDSVVGSLGSADAWLDGSEVQLHDVSAVGGVLLVVSPELVLSGVVLDGLDLVLVSSGQLQVVDGLLIDGEVSHGGSVLGSHVGDGGSVSQAEVLETWSEELDEFSDDSSLSKLLSDGQDQIGGGDVLSETSVQLESNNFWQDHGN